MPEIEPWAKMDDTVTLLWPDQIATDVEVRLAKGREIYESHIKGFQGNPLDRLEEEALDILVYLKVAQRRERWLEARVKELEEFVNRITNTGTLLKDFPEASRESILLELTDRAAEILERKSYDSN